MGHKKVYIIAVVIIENIRSYMEALEVVVEGVVEA